MLGVLLLVLAACGPQVPSATTGSGATTGSASGSPTHPTPIPTPTPTPTTIRGHGSIHGCPSNTVFTTPLKQANVIIEETDTNDTVSAHVGDLIEIRLPFGQKWSGPASIPGNLQQQQPAGYAFTPDNVCIWRFVAQSEGVAHLDFYMQALCLSGQMCPRFIANIPFIINIK
jgi:hypothetical protein